MRIRLRLRIAVAGLVVAGTTVTSGCTLGFDDEDERNADLAFWYTGFDCGLFDPSSHAPFDELPVELKHDPDADYFHEVGEPGAQPSSDATALCAYHPDVGPDERDAGEPDQNQFFKYYVRYAGHSLDDSFASDFDPEDEDAVALGVLDDVAGFEDQWERVGTKENLYDLGDSTASSFVFAFLDGNMSIRVSISIKDAPIDDMLREQALTVALECAEQIRANSEYDFESDE